MHKCTFFVRLFLSSCKKVFFQKVFYSPLLFFLFSVTRRGFNCALFGLVRSLERIRMRLIFLVVEDLLGDELSVKTRARLVLHRLSKPKLVLFVLVHSNKLLVSYRTITCHATVYNLHK